MSETKLNVAQAVGVQVVRAADRKPATATKPSILKPKGRFQVEHWRDGEIIGTHDFPNGIVNEGKDHLLDSTFDGATQITLWYLGLIDLSGFTALDATDTADDINQVGNGWDEFSDYTDANNADSAVTRPVWVADPASAQSITNSTVAIYDITVAGDVKGIFTVGGGTTALNKDAHAADATLWATALFTSGDVAVLIADQLKITYTVSA